MTRDQGEKTHEPPPSPPAAAEHSSESCATAELPASSLQPPATDHLCDLEAILLTSDRAASPKRIAQAIGLDSEEGARRVGEMAGRLNEQYEQTGRAFRIEKTAGGLRLMTLAACADAVAAYHNLGASGRLSRAALETLAIIAYRQPITRAQIETIRGVGSGEVLRSLLERRLVAITGRAEEVGRPILYGTSKHFLEQFGLASLKDLPPAGQDAAKELSE